jgi:integrase
VDTLIAECRDDALRFVLFCGFHAGMRKEEVIEARPEWFDLASGHVHIGPTPTWIPKDRERRSVPLSPSFRLFLAGYGLPSPYMLAPKVKRGRARYRYDFRRPFQAHLKACGVRCTFHDARRTFASLLVSAGVSIYKVAKYLGDGVGVVEKHYGHLQADNGELDRVFG